MATDHIEMAALNALRSSEHENLLDEIDSLRSQGISEFVFLPQIVVCGDQSSGKSSVLEAISGVPFPRNDVLCTRFATEVILRKAPATEAEVSIVPSQDVSDIERTKLLAFREKLQGLDDLSQVIERAKTEMGISPTGSAFSKSILRVEIAGPEKPRLTLVDLPGLIHSNSRQQSPEDVELISGLVRSYMKNPRSIILAVVSAKNDYANQIVLKRAREVDREGLRTLGLITKPDTLPAGSDSEADFINLASNDNIQFRLGWHVVKNRDYHTRHSSAEERDCSEAQFFSQGVWKDLPREMVGIHSLGSRLSKILLDQVKRHLSTLIEDIRANIEACTTKLAKLGDSRSTIEEQRQFLLKLSQSFQTLCRSAIHGSYDENFFGDPSTDDEYCKRLRAVVQNLNLDFAKLMREKGHRRTIRSDDESLLPLTEKSRGNLQPIPMSRKSALEWVKTLLVRSRGRELPGSFNPLLVNELFRDQSKPWERIAREHVKVIWTALKAFLEKLFHTLTDDETFGALFTHWIDPKTRERFKSANQTLDRLLVDRERHAITYNHYYTEVLQKIREERQMKTLKGKIKEYMQVNTFYENNETSINELTATLTAQTEKDMDAFACSELLDSMHAFYKVAMKTFIDNVSIQVVESHLVGDVFSVFSPTDVGQMPPDLVSKIAAESVESQALRQQLQRKLQTLVRGMDICQRHAMQPIDGHASAEPLIPDAESKNASDEDAESEYASDEDALSHTSYERETGSSAAVNGKPAVTYPPLNFGVAPRPPLPPPPPPASSLPYHKGVSNFDC